MEERFVWAAGIKTPQSLHDNLLREFECGVQVAAISSLVKHEQGAFASVILSQRLWFFLLFLFAASQVSFQILARQLLPA